MKIAFIHELPIEMLIHWDDGLAAALNLLGQEHTIIFRHVDSSLPPVDMVLAWGGATSRPAEAALGASPKKGLLYGGGVLEHANISKFDVLFVENEYNFNQVNHPNKKVAFGTNTDLFIPITQQKVWDMIYPAAFAKYKNHKKFIEIAEGKRALCVGHIQVSERDIVKEVQMAGIQILPWVPYSVMPFLYNSSREVVLTPDPFGGCERAVLEAASCNIPVRLETECPKVLCFKDVKNSIGSS